MKIVQCNWTILNIQSVLKLGLSIFILSGILFIPFTFQLITFQSVITEFLFGGMVDFLTDSLGINLYLHDFSSDSKRIFLLLFVLGIFSFILTFTLIQFNLSEQNQVKLNYIIRRIALYYLACILLKYGFDKLFKSQFYLPEPNILNTRLGNLDKDILFWSTMGSSYSYSVFMGMMEIIPGTLILFKKTRNLGLLIAIGVFTNVVAINFSFDISVKLFSTFLLLISVYLFAPFIPRLWNVFMGNSFTEKLKVSNLVIKQKKSTFLLESGIILFILIESLLPYIKSNNFNDDTFQRPLLHSSYELQYSFNEKDTLYQNENTIKRIFIHRDNYLIFQDQNEKMYDYKLTIDPIKQQFILEEDNLPKQKFSYSYSSESKILRLQQIDTDKQETFVFKKTNWREMPLLQKQFHWTVD